MTEALDESLLKHELAHLTRKEVLDGLERIHELTLSIWPRKSISIYYAFLEIENIAKRLLEREQDQCQ